MNSLFGASAHEGFAKNINKIGVKHSILHSQLKKERINTMKTNKITCRRVDDYNIPNLILPPEEANITLDKWGMLHKDYLLKYKKVVFVTLIAEGKLWQYLADIDTQAQQIFDTFVEQMKSAEGITEQLK